MYIYMYVLRLLCEVWGRIVEPALCSTLFKKDDVQCALKGDTDQESVFTKNRPCVKAD